jgi:hypothetical protein
VGIQRDYDDGGAAEPIRPGHTERRIGHVRHLAVGTLACPSCDAPVAPGEGPMSPADPLGCPYCGRDGAVRDFLSLTSPARPARVVVRVVLRGSRARV